MSVIASTRSKDRIVIQDVDCVYCKEYTETIEKLTSALTGLMWSHRRTLRDLAAQVYPGRDDVLENWLRTDKSRVEAGAILETVKGER